MDSESNLEKSKKRLKIYYNLLVTIICIIGVSFAWFNLYQSQSEDNTIASRNCFNLNLTEETSKITLSEAYPIIDADGLKQTPFTFTIKNKCNNYVKMYITIDSIYRQGSESSYLKDTYLKVNISPKGTTSNQSVILGSQSLIDIDSNKKGYVIIEGSLNPNEEKSYDLRIWMDEAVTIDQGLNKSWEGQIVIVGKPSSGQTFKDTILANNTVKSTLTTPGKEVSAHTIDDIEAQTISVTSTYRSYYITYGTGWKANGTKFDLTGTTVTTNTYANSYSSLIGKYLNSSTLSNIGSKVEGTMKNTNNLNSVVYVVNATTNTITYKEITSNKNTTEALLASTEDDYGTSYYFRGAVKNNYLEFANKCWRIVRILGDGSVKLILHNDNTNKVSNPCSSVNNSPNAAYARYSGSTYQSAFNSSYNDNAYIGFMYGKPNSDNYADTHANTNKSTILTNLENWYKENLLQYDDKLADTIWCNDKSIVTDTTYNPFGRIITSKIGYGKNASYFSPVKRLVSSDESTNNSNPSLICSADSSNSNLSKFTVSDTVNGNGNLTYKIGLLTADEIAFAGSIYNNYNHSAYLQENAGTIWWWTLSPNGYDGDSTLVWLVRFGFLKSFGVDGDYHGLRPSIALVPETEVTGSGTSEDPYIIK